MQVITPMLLFVALLPHAVSGNTQHGDQRPNIIFIFSDDHGYQAISAYEDRLISTPNIDRLANEGVRFDRCYVTNSICGPSRACILTGQYSHKIGYYNNNDRFDPDLVTFPKLLQESGYQTALIGKWHLGKASPQGFDHWRILDHQGYYYQPKMIERSGNSQHVGYVTDLITRYSLDWLEQQRQATEPFLLMIQHKAPHRPWDPGPKHLNTFTGKHFSEPETLFDDYVGRSSAVRDVEMRIADHLNAEGPDLKAWDNDRDNGHRDWFYDKLTLAQHRDWRTAFVERNATFYSGDLKGKELVRWKYQRLMQDYLACVQSIDDSVAEILGYVDEAGLADNTVVIYCSDQGFFLGEHGWFDKRLMYEPALRTPLLIRWPGVAKAGTVCDSIVSNLDFAQTFLDMANVEAPPQMQGRSFVPLLRGKTPDDWRRSFYYHYYEGREGGHAVCKHEGVTNGRHKLIHFYPIKEWEMFDLEVDPLEMKNVASSPEYAKTRDALEDELQRLREELGVE